MATPFLPPNHRGLVFTEFQKPPSVQTLPTPQPGPGSAVVRILSAIVVQYSRKAYFGIRPGYPYTTPMVPGASAIARVASAGPDATRLQPGQLVFVDLMVRARDDPATMLLQGFTSVNSPGGKTLMDGEWRHGAYAEYMKAPLENIHALDEARLLGPAAQGGLGYTVHELAYLAVAIVPWGGLRDINLQPGETIVIAPATGGFGGAAVRAARAIGVRVVAMGRNAEELARMKGMDPEVETVQIVGDVEAETKALAEYGPIDVFLDISPPTAAKSTHLRSALLSLRRNGRASFMGGIGEDISIPYWVIGAKNVMLKGKIMYEKEDVAKLIKMIERGNFKVGKKDGYTVNGPFGLEQWEEAFESAEKNAGAGSSTVIVP